VGKAALSSTIQSAPARLFHLGKDIQGNWVVVEVEQTTKSEVAAVIARLCEDYADDMIGTPCEA
jgi:hypothetical protein